jgi:hypothetical protein
MKQAQWLIAGLLLVVLVFGITFFVTYLGNPGTQPLDPLGPGDDGGGSRLEVTFPVRDFPPTEQPPVDQEIRKAGYHDFWFTNGNDKAVKVGLNKKNCTCSSVLLFVASPEAASQPPNESQIKELEKSIQPTVLSEQDNVAVVPPNGAGWVRLGWSGERNQVGQVTTLTASLWMDKRGSESSLGTRVRFLEPLQVPPELRGNERAIGELNMSQLPYTFQMTCFSPTRPEFKVKTRVISLQADPQAEPIELGAPVPLKKEECEALERLFPDGQTRVKSGYHVPVIVRGRQGDGKTPAIAGPFRRRVEMGIEDDPLEPITVMVSGRIQGDLMVGDQEDGGRVDFRVFDRKKGSRQTLILRSNRPGLKVELDREKTPGFLDARIPEPRVTDDGKSVWQVEVEVLPGRASGTFGHGNDPVYRDCAVYLRAVGPTTQSVRIPVVGTANDR